MASEYSIIMSDRYSEIRCMPKYFLDNEIMTFLITMEEYLFRSLRIGSLQISRIVRILEDIFSALLEETTSSALSRKQTIHLQTTSLDIVKHLSSE